MVNLLARKNGLMFTLFSRFVWNISYYFGCTWKMVYPPCLLHACSLFNSLSTLNTSDITKQHILVPKLGRPDLRFSFKAE